MISCPSTVSPVIVDAETLPEALTEPAATLARMSSEVDRDLAGEEGHGERADAGLRARGVPGWATTWASAEPILTIEPSSGYA